MAATRVLVIGAAGRMGREVVRAVQAEAELELCGGVEVAAVGQDIGELAGIGPLGLPLSADLEATLRTVRPEVAVVFTSPAATAPTLRTLLANRVAPVVGSTGWYDLLPEFEQSTRETGVPMFVAPNFAIGAALMMKFAQQAAQYLDHVEIIELHHDRKVDAPSGTAEWTARLIAESRAGRPMQAAPTARFNLPGVRGGSHQGIVIHSVRLPGFVAHQEIIFGGLGQVLTIRHDSTDRTSFMPGVVLACRRVRSLAGLTVGLEQLL